MLFFSRAFFAALFVVSSLDFVFLRKTHELGVQAVAAATTAYILSIAHSWLRQAQRGRITKG